MSKQRKTGTARKNWIEEDRRFLCDNYCTMPSCDIAKHLNRTIATVRTIARSMGITKRNVSYFTKDETLFLVDNYGSMPSKDIATKMNRTESSIEHKAMRLGLTEKRVAQWKYCVDCGKKLSSAAIYRDSVERCPECSRAFQQDENHPLWKGGVSSLEGLVYVLLRPVWGKPIMRRDNYTCQICGQKGGNKEVHHVRLLTQIRDEVRSAHPELDIANLSDKKKLAVLIVKAHQLQDGITLCKPCHKSIHTEKSGELLEYPNVKTRAISSQASEGKGSEEGSTTRFVSPNNNQTHERPTLLCA